MFDGDEVEPLTQEKALAIHTNTKIKGLYLHPELRISPEISASLLKDIEEGNCFPSGANQVMLFGRTTASSSGVISSGLPQFIDSLIEKLTDICRPFIPETVHNLLFPQGGGSYSRQAILNRYQPGQGISPHVDLLKRYGDGIIGVSLGCGCVMDFVKVGYPGDGEQAPNQERVSLWLPENSVIILVGEARYSWTHGIQYVHGDVVENPATGLPEWVPRGFRTSITLRWLLPGADIVGPST